MNNTYSATQTTQTERDQLIVFCSAENLQPLIVAEPVAQPAAILDAILINPLISGILCGEGDSSNPAIGRFIAEQYDWQLPEKTAEAIACNGPRSLLSFQMVRAALQHNIHWLVYRTSSGYQKERVIQFLISRLLQRIIEPLEGSFNESCQRFNSLVIKTTVQRYRDTLRWYAETIAQPRTERAMSLFLKHKSTPQLEAQAFIPNRILIIAPSLAVGGLGRNVVNTALGLVNQGYCDITLLCLSLNHNKNDDFFLPQLSGSPIEVIELPAVSSFRTSGQLSDDQLNQITKILKPLPKNVANQALPISCELLLRRPDVVHLWGDNVNTCGGIAAILVGVPRFVITLTHLTPEIDSTERNSYFKPCYQAIIDHPDCSLLSTCQAITDDYQQWLERPDKTIPVISSVVSRERLESVSTAQSEAYRNQLGIPDDAIVIGSVMHFSAEKEPALWLKVALEVAAARADVYFLLIGDGPLFNTIQRQARKSKLGNRFIMPGVTTNPALPLSLLDLFLSTARRAGLPNAVLEAQLFGVPVIACHAGGTNYAVDSSHTGWIESTHDAHKIAYRIIETLNDHAWLKQVGTACDHFLAGCFKVRWTLEKILASYDYPTYYKPVNSNLSSRELSEEAFRSAVDYAIQNGNGYLNKMKKVGIEPLQCRVLELGPGINYGAMMILACHGARPTIVDRFASEWHEEYHRPFYTLLAKTVKKNNPAINTAPIEALLDASGYPAAILTTLSCGAEEISSVEDGAFDITCSIAVFEHLHSPLRTFRELARVTRSGGYGFHQIDFRDHRDFSRPLEYLLFEPRAFERFFRSQLSECGRQYRATEYNQLCQVSGFKIIKYNSNLVADSAYLDDFIPRLRAAEGSRYQNFSREALTDISANIIIQRDDSSAHSA